jgi:hypothetical protein
MLAYQRDYYAAHRGKDSAAKKAYRKKHRKRIAQYRLLPP